ncbi:hypothetical protein FGB62_263g01 [Gracilaria domingensis]|nr:hypothetical protein FGB62_263g01 [Gracilaria domingensis]
MHRALLRLTSAIEDDGVGDNPPASPTPAIQIKLPAPQLLPEAVEQSRNTAFGPTAAPRRHALIEEAANRSQPPNKRQKTKGGRGYGFTNSEVEHLLDVLEDHFANREKSQIRNGDAVVGEGLDESEGRKRTDVEDELKADGGEVEPAENTVGKTLTENRLVGGSEIVARRLVNSRPRNSNDAERILEL